MSNWNKNHIAERVEQQKRVSNGSLGTEYRQILIQLQNNLKDQPGMKEKIPARDVLQTAIKSVLDNTKGSKKWDKELFMKSIDIVNHRLQRELVKNDYKGKNKDYEGIIKQTMADFDKLSQKVIDNDKKSQRGMKREQQKPDEAPKPSTPRGR